MSAVCDAIEMGQNGKDNHVEIMKKLQRFLGCSWMLICVSLLTNSLPSALSELALDDCTICKDILQVHLVFSNRIFCLTLFVVCQ